MNPLTTIPPAVRTALYWVGYVVGVAGQGITIVWGSIAAASPDVTMPLWLVIASAVLGLVQTQLNLLAGSNVPATPAPTRTDVRLTLSADSVERLQQGADLVRTVDATATPDTDTPDEEA